MITNYAHCSESDILTDANKNDVPLKHSVPCTIVKYFYFNLLGTRLRIRLFVVFIIRCDQFRA